MLDLSFIACSLLIAVCTDTAVRCDSELWLFFFLLSGVASELVALQELTLHFPLFTLAFYEIVQVFCLFDGIVIKDSDLTHMEMGRYL